MLNLNNKVAIVTGGAKGLGLAIAKQLHSFGVQVIILDIDAQALESISNDFSKYVVDITNKQAVIELLSTISQQHSKIDILINNAGVIHSKPLINLTNKTDRVHDYEEYKKIIDLNLNSVFLMGSLVAEKMIMSRTKGIIINMSSICAGGNAGQSAYSAAKAGVNALTKCWAKELGSFGIRVIAIAPGFIDTPSTNDSLSPQIIQDLQQRIPLRKLGQDVDIANMVVAAISNNYISGTIIEVHGGLSI